MDPGNPVVKLCAAGMQAESERRHDDAAALFRQAWSERTDAFDACIAAHFVARHQPTPEECLAWNREALAQADAVADDRVLAFYPSLYLNLGHAHEVLGDAESARRLYDLAAQRLPALPAGDAYGDLVRRGVAEGLRRVSAPERNDHDRGRPST